MVAVHGCPSMFHAKLPCRVIQSIPHDLPISHCLFPGTGPNSRCSLPGNHLTTTAMSGTLDLVLAKISFILPETLEERYV